MTIKKLIKELKQYPENTEILIQDNNDNQGIYNYITNIYMRHKIIYIEIKKEDE